jgi:lipopolysaccharide/colanic/teichoic acid biosynthesis glycosyltransferase
MHMKADLPPPRPISSSGSMLAARGREPVIWARPMFQLFGSLLLALGIPYPIAAMITPDLLALNLYYVSLAASGMAIVLAFWTYRNLAGCPGIKASYYILPVFLSSFVAMFTVLFLTRLGYSRPLLVASFVIALAWFYVVYFMIQRRQTLAIAVVPFGRVDSLYGIDQVHWAILDTPMLPPIADLLTADFDADLPPAWLNFLAECALQGTTVLHFKQLRQSLTGQVQTEHLSENADGALAPSANYIALKRLIDSVVALALLPVLLPLFVLVAAAIRLDSRGGVFFRQVRIGYRGKPFTLWKFRTMRAAPAAIETPGVSHDPRHSAITRADDPRITRLGRWLRRSRIDELPQIINVLRGEMSWIGPRPEALELSRWYESELPFYRYRHVVRPGISGWAQVSQGHVADLDSVLKKLNFDFFYISRFSLWLDVLIVLRTIKTMLTGYGSR